MEHIPVLLDESIEGLNIKPDGIYVDGTLGRGGHSLEILKKLDTGRLIAIDCDTDAVKETTEKLKEYGRKITVFKGNFRNLAEILRQAGEKAADGMLFDLGVSSPQLDDVSRGFSYMQDAPLDMRMDRENTLTAYEIINKSDFEELSGIFFNYGEERYSKQIAREIIRRREVKPVETTLELSEIIISAIPAAARREQQHPAKRCFQALRIAVGDELGALEEVLNAIPKLLKPGGRVCIISFHSIEDRMVKQAFTEYSQGCVCPKDFPVCVCNKKPLLRKITKKPVTADKESIDKNPRARSAKLRIAEKL